MKVAQGNGLPVDVVGMRLDDVVKKIRPKGTEVRLTVKSRWYN
jgi:carboxyl-terminal processing protease